MPRLAARVIVSVVSGAVLVLEILAARLLAPYVGVTLETYTAIIGVVLAGIAAGSWVGGVLADRLEPRRLLGPTILAGGALAIAAVPVIRLLGDAFSADIRVTSVVLAAAAFFLPALVLSAVHPTVVKLALRDLDHTGEVVGSFTGVATLGALVGTFLTGFVLVAAVPTRAVIYVVGGLLALLGLGLWAWLGRRDAAVMGALIVVLAGSSLLATRSLEPCDVESAYACIRVEKDPRGGHVRQLWLNEGLQGAMDLADPERLHVAYMQTFADVLRVAWGQTRPLRTLHVGGGAFVMPRYLEAVRPGSRNLVLEVDPAVVEVGREDLGLRESRTLRVRTGDARTGIRGVATDSMDLVIGDAFQGLTVPWHLTTREFIAEIDRVLRRDGIYLLNVIDAGGLDFARAQLATLRERFTWVAAILREPTLEAGSSGNIVAVAASRPLDAATLETRVREQGYLLLLGPAVDRLADGAPILTDDFAPVDHLLTRT